MVEELLRYQEEEEQKGVSRFQLMKRRFLKHRLGVAGLVILVLLYLSAIFAGFLAPYALKTMHSGMKDMPPTKIRFVDAEGRFHVRPFVYGIKGEMDKKTFKRVYVEDPETMYPIKLFVKGDPYKFWNLFNTDRHLFGVDEPARIFIFGTDRNTRDLLSRIIYGSRLSLTIGLIGVTMSLIFGCIMGAISAWFGGTVDMVIQRGIEVLQSFPRLPLWMALSAAIPPQISPIAVYFSITIVLSFLSWGSLARSLRAILLRVREEEFVLAARSAGAGSTRIMFKHLIPNAMTYIIVQATLAIPNMILGETSLSFLGLGLRPPLTSWGVLLREAQFVRVLKHTPWVVIPVFFVIVTVLAFNFLGDGLRDAADPYST